MTGCCFPWRWPLPLWEWPKSTARPNTNQSETFYVKQIYFVVFGLALLLLVVSLDYRILSQQVPYIYLGAVLLLLLALFIAPAVHGTRGWIPLGPLNFQPAEFAKVAVVLTLARFLGETRTRLLTFNEIIKACLLVGLPLGLILLQPDLGSAITLVPPLVRRSRARRSPAAVDLNRPGLVDLDYCRGMV